MFLQRALKCFSTEFAPRQVSEEVARGGKIFLPPSTLESLAQTNVSYPLMFEVKNQKENLSLHCGILEFTAEEGRAYLPRWMLNQLKVEDGMLLTIKYKSLPLGRFIKIQPQSEAFLDISNPRAVLEKSLRDFSCLSEGDLITITYNSKPFEIKVLETKPANAVSIVEADVQVDFAAPPGYVEPSSKELPEPTPVAEVSPAQPTFIPFSGSGNSLSGRQRSPSSPAPHPTSSPSPSPPAPKSSPSSSPPKSASPSPFSFNASAKPSAVVVPAGKLVFGKLDSSKLPSDPSQPVPTGGFKAFSGAGNSLKSSR